MKRVMIDMDSILADTLTPWCEAYNAEYNDDLTPARIKRWDFIGCIKPECKNILKYIGEPGFFRNLKPLPGAIEAVQYLHGLKKFDIIVCTAAMGARSHAEKTEWFTEHLNFLGKRQLMFAHRKEWLKADAYLDDGPENLKAIRESWPEAHVLTIDYPYNRFDWGDPAPHVNLRAGSFENTTEAWKTIVEYLERELG